MTLRICNTWQANHLKVVLASDSRNIDYRLMEIVYPVVSETCTIQNYKSVKHFAGGMDLNGF